MKKKAVIFDLDGTLMHTLPDIDKSLRMALETLGYPLNTYEDTLRGINNGVRRLVMHVMPDGVSEEALGECIDVYTEYYEKHYSDTTEPFDGLALVIDKLYEAGYRLAVLSNKQDPFTRALIEKGFPGKFSPVIGQGKYATKPSTEAPFAIADEWGLCPNEIIFVGDSDVDMKTAVNSGMYPLGVGWGYRAPELLLSAGAKEIAMTPDELYSAITRLAEGE